MFRRLPEKTTMALLLMILIFAGCSTLYISSVTTVALKEQTRDELAYLAALIAQEIDGDAVRTIQPGDEQGPAFLALAAQLTRYRETLPEIKYIYIMRLDGDRVLFVVDPATDNGTESAAIGEVYPDPPDAMVTGFTETSVDADFTTDEWGTTLSGYSPVRDRSGAIVGLVGVDMDQATALQRQTMISLSSYMIVFLAILMAVFGVLGVESTRSRMVQDLTDREKRFRTLFESTYDGILIVRDGNFIDCNEAAQRIFHATKNEIVLKTIADLSPPAQPDGADSAVKVKEILAKVLKGAPQTFVWKHRTVDGVDFDADVSLTRIELDGAVAIQAIVRDITEKKRAEDALKQSEQKYRMLSESSPDAIYIVDGSHKVVYANMLASTLMAEGLRDIIGFSKDGWPPGAETKGNGDIITQVLVNGQILKQEDQLTTRGGKGIWLDSTFMPLLDEKGATYAVLGVSHDITARKTMETQIAGSLQEKEYLIKEIHHRVKNNLQVISSLLSMQARKVADPVQKEILTESQNRVKSIALVHEKLYQSRSLDRIEYGDYLKKVITHLFESFNVNPAQIRWNVAAEEIYVNIEQAVPCSLMLNEMITNSIKYAFPQGRKGEILISFTLEGGNYVLDYRDNGVGVAEGAKLERSGSLGMQLISGLTRQLDGRLSVDTTAGVHYTIIFPQKQKGDGSA